MESDSEITPDVGVGKTSIIKRYVHNIFSMHYKVRLSVSLPLPLSPRLCYAIYLRSAGGWPLIMYMFISTPANKMNNIFVRRRSEWTLR
jgi:GTPase SAR1 family protein